MLFVTKFFLTSSQNANCTYLLDHYCNINSRMPKEKRERWVGVQWCYPFDFFLSNMFEIYRRHNPKHQTIYHPKLCGNWVFQQNLHAGKLGKIWVIIPWKDLETNKYNFLEKTSKFNLQQFVKTLIMGKNSHFKEVKLFLDKMCKNEYNIFKN